MSYLDEIKECDDRMVFDPIYVGRQGAYAIDVLSWEDALNYYPEVWMTAKNLFPGLDDCDIAKIVSLVTDTCSSCYATQRGCQCWNNE